MENIGTISENCCYEVSTQNERSVRNFVISARGIGVKENKNVEKDEKRRQK